MCSNRLNVVLQTLEGKSIHFRAKPQTSVAAIAKATSSHCGIPPHELRLMHMFHHLRWGSGASLRDVEVEDGSCVDMVEETSGGGAAFNFADISNAGEGPLHEGCNGHTLPHTACMRACLCAYSACL